MGFIDKVQDFGREAGEKITELGREAGEKIGDVIDDVKRETSEGGKVDHLLDNVTDTFKDVAANVGEKASHLTDVVQDKFEDVTEKVKEFTGVDAEPVADVPVTQEAPVAPESPEEESASAV